MTLLAALTRLRTNNLKGLSTTLTFGRKVVLVGPNDKEIVVEPGPELGLKATTNAAAASSGFIEPAVGYVERYADPVAALCSGSINDFAENGFVR